MNAFSSSLDHVLAELKRVDLFLHLQVRRARRARGGDDRFAGLYISEPDVDTILDEPAGLPRWATAPDAPEDRELYVALHAIEESLASRKAASTGSAVALRLDRVATLFELDRFDQDALLVSLAPEIDLRYERLFAYLQDDVQKRRPTVDVLLNLLCPTLLSKLEARRRFRPSAPLVEHQLVELFDDPSRPEPPLLGKCVRVDPSIASFLLGSDDLDPAIASHASLCVPRIPVALESAEARGKSEAVAERALDGSAVLHVLAPRGVGGRDWAVATSARANRPLLVVDGASILDVSVAEFKVLAKKVVREAALRSADIYWEGFDGLLVANQGVRRDALLGAILRGHARAYLEGSTPWSGETSVDDLRVLRVELPSPSAAERAATWSRALIELSSNECVAEAPALAAKFSFAEAEVRAVVRDARDRALLRGGALRPHDIYAASRTRSSARLGELAKKIQPLQTWNDLVLPADAEAQLRELCERVRLRALVLEEWGFERRLSLGLGLHALFAGPSGTGKTMAAEVIAGELGLDLFKIDLSAIVSKYIGETEKNLARIFSEAEASSAILFFDEADALFGKRSEVKDAHDRYANVETAFLLQRIEEYAGVTILATNLRRNMDEAFLRRLAVIVPFPSPEPAERLLIWKRIFPAATPRSNDVDLEFLARQFKFSGGNIKNVALAAAFLAASDGRSLSMAHLVRATKRELQKIGKTLSAAEFGPYAKMLEG